jgi:hypothetical protein
VGGCAGPIRPPIFQGLGPIAFLVGLGEMFVHKIFHFSITQLMLLVRFF